MEIGASTSCLYPLETERSLEKLLSMGCRLFEVFLNAKEELEPAFLRQLKERATDFGAKFVSVHPYTSAAESMLLFGNYPRRTKEGFRFYEKYFEAAAFLKAKYVVIHGQQLGHGALSDEGYWERFGELTQLGKRVGVRPAQENVYNHRSSKMEFLLGMRTYLGENCAFVLDVKQCLRSGVTAEETAEAMGESLCHLHVSDSSPGHDCLVPGKGVFPFSSFFRFLEEREYPGSAVIEVYRSNFGAEEELEKSLEFIKEWQNL